MHKEKLESEGFYESRQIYAPYEQRYGIREFERVLEDGRVEVLKFSFDSNGTEYISRYLRRI